MTSVATSRQPPLCLHCIRPAPSDPLSDAFVRLQNRQYDQTVAQPPAHKNLFILNSAMKSDFSRNAKGLANRRGEWASRTRQLLGRKRPTECIGSYFPLFFLPFLFQVVKAYTNTAISGEWRNVSVSMKKQTNFSTVKRVKWSEIKEGNLRIVV